MTREEVMNELKDICAVIDEDGDIVAEDSLDRLATRLMEEGSEDISEDELDAINGMIYDSFAEPATICNELVNMLMNSNIKVEDIEDPLMADMWDDLDLSDEEVAALTAEGPNYAEFPDHEYQEGCNGKECKEEVEEPAETEEVTEEVEATEETEEVKEGYYRGDSIIDGDIPGKENSFIDLITMRFHNLGLDEYTHPIYDGESIPESHAWCPYKKNAALMFGPDEAFFQPAVDYIKTEENREDSSWYQRPYAVVKVGDRYNRKMGEYALCIFATNDDFCNTTEMSRKGVEKAAELRRMRKGTKPAA
jgi:hypothetical protein